MTETPGNNTRIAKNAFFLYVRMILTMVVSLYTSRVVLQVLGVSDFGLYNVVGGVVSLLAFVNGTLASGTQRFLSYELGREDVEQLKTVFSTALLLHFILAVLIVVLSETVGVWFIYNKMNIAADRMQAAFWTFQFSVLAMAVSIIQVPFMASVIAHEKMNVYAYISVYDTVMKLVAVVLIQFIHYDKLVLYGGLILFVTITGELIYNLYCRSQYEECRFRFKYNKVAFHDIVVFSGWNIVGCTAATLQVQGVNVLLNIFCGTIVNAARGIAFQVNGAISQFVGSIQAAVNPQIVKLYAAGQMQEMTKLVLMNSRLAAFFLLLLTIPVFIEVEFILRIWLGTYPVYTPIFVRIILIQSVFQTITRPLVMVTHACGRLKMVSLTAGIILAFSFPVSYILLKTGNSPVVVFIVNVIPWITETLLILYWMRRYIGFPVKSFFKEVYIAVLPWAVVMYLVPYAISVFMSNKEIVKFLFVVLTSLCVSSFILYFQGMDAQMRIAVRHKIKSIINNRMNTVI